MAGDRQGPRLKRAMGQEKSTEGSRDQMTCTVLMCVHAGRREPQGRIHSEKRGGQKKEKKPKTKLHSTTEGREAQSEQAAGEWEGANGQTRDRGWRKKKHQQQRVTRWGKGTGTGGHRAQEEGPPTGPEGNTPPKRKGAGRERPVVGTRNGPRMDEDPVGLRHRVAGGPVGYKHGTMGKGDETEKGVGL